MAYWEPLRELDEAPLVQVGSSLGDVTHDISRVTENRAPRGWWICFLIALSFTKHRSTILPSRIFVMVFSQIGKLKTGLITGYVSSSVEYSVECSQQHPCLDIPGISPSFFGQRYD